MTAETVTEQQRIVKPKLPEVSIARLLMGKSGRLERDVPSYFNLPDEFQLYVDREHSNGTTRVVFEIRDVTAADRYLHLRNKAAEEFINQNRLI